MGGFAFDTPKTVEICGKEYECDPRNPDMMIGAGEGYTRIVNLAEKFRQLSENPEIAMDELKAANQELTMACKDMIEGCLGEAEYQEIFRERRPNSTEHLKLCTYLFQYLTEGRGEIVEDYLDLPEGKEDAAHPSAAEDTWPKDRYRIPEVAPLWPDAGFSPTAPGGKVCSCPSEHPGGDTGRQ